MRQAIRRLGPQITKLVTSELPILSNAVTLRTASSSSCKTSAAIISAGGFRNFRSTSFAASSLADVLRNEIDYEKQNYSQPEELAGGPPSPFTLTETRGDTLMSLSRQFGSNETINIDVMVNDQPEEEPFETEEGVLDVDVGVLFTAQVVKGEQSLVFECKSDGSYLSIMHVAVEPANGEMEDSAYTGPVFEELDDELQRQFQLYLEQRGVGPELGGYLLRLVHDKEEREYQYWLEKTAAFLKM
jgi:hypothetical protein